jgi:hypothetical protein
VKRRVYNLIILLCVVLVALDILLWPASYWMSGRAQIWRYRVDSTRKPATVHIRTYDVTCYHGAVFFSCGWMEEPTNPGERTHSHVGWEWSIPPRILYPATSWPYDSLNVQFLGFQLRRYTAGVPGDRWSETILAVPLWAFLLLSIPPAIWWRKRGQASRGFPIDTSQNQANPPTGI